MKNWESKPLRQALAQIKTGSTPSTKQPEFFNGEIPFFTPGDIGNDVFLTNAVRSITDSAIKDGKAKTFDKDTLLVTCIGDIGRVGILQSRASANQQITALTFKQNIDVKYAYFWFCLHQAQLQELANQAVVPILNNERLQSIEFFYPPLEEQQRIADLLSRADRLRRLRRFALEMSAGYLQAVFLEMFGDPVTNPMGWEVVPVSKLGKVTTGNTPPRAEPKYYGNHTEWIKTDNIPSDRLLIDPSSEMLSQIGLKVGRTVEAGALLIACIAGSVSSLGRAALTDRRVAFNQQINAIAPNKDVDSFFLYGLFRIAQTAVQKAASDGMKHLLSKSSLENIRLIKPPLERQKEFADVLVRYERLRAQQREALRQAEHLFQGLLQAAFRGEV
jgi:type I restriction enzyme, S subunit